jgi:transcriptional regulator with XRE-family HTH domain
MPNPSSVGERVRALRLSRKLSQSQLARPDLSDSYVSLIESGKRTPTQSVIMTLAERLGCTPEFLADGAEPEHLTHGRLRLYQARLALLGGDGADAAVRFAALAEHTTTDDPALAWTARYGRVGALERLDHVNEAIAVLEELRERAETRPDRLPVLPLITDLSRCYYRAGDLALSVELGEHALDRLRSYGLERGPEVLGAAAVLILAYVEHGDAEAAALLGARLADETAAEPTPRDYLAAGDIAAGQGFLGDAVYLCERAAWRGGGAASTERAWFALGYGELLLRLDPPEPELAATMLARAENAFAGDRVPRTMSALGRARAALIADRPAEALRRATGALDGLGEPGEHAPIAVARVHVVIGQARSRLDDPAGARESFQTAGDVLDTVESSREVARTWRELGDLLDELDDADGVADAYRRALETAGLHPSPGSWDSHGQPAAN